MRVKKDIPSKKSSQHCSKNEKHYMNSKFMELEKDYTLYILAVLSFLGRKHCYIRKKYILWSGVVYTPVKST